LLSDPFRAQEPNLFFRVQSVFIRGYWLLTTDNWQLTTDY